MASPNMLTLADAMELVNAAKNSTGLDSASLQRDSALLGNYVLTNSQAANEVNRRAKGLHAADNPGGLGLTGLPGGKLPGHPTFSDESPYAIKGLEAAEGGTWSKDKSGWVYAPSESQFKRNPNYVNELRGYFEREQGKGIDKVVLPDGTVWQ